MSIIIQCPTAQLLTIQKFTVTIILFHSPLTNTTNKMIFLILKGFLNLSIFISVSYSIDVFKYSNRNFESPAYSTTKLSLEKMEKVFTICSYHFQKQINENSVSIYTLHDSLNSADPLMFLGIWKPNKLWLFVNDKWFDLGAVPFSILQ